MAGQGGGQLGERLAAIRHMQPGERPIKIHGRRGFGEDHAGSGGERVTDEAMAIDGSAADGGKERAGLDIPRGCGEGGHIRVQRAGSRDSGKTGNKITEYHRAAAVASGGVTGSVGCKFI